MTQYTHKRAQMWKYIQTFAAVLPDSSNSFFHVADVTGTTENPEATNIPIHNPYPNPPDHQPFSKEKANTINLQKKKQKMEYLFTSLDFRKKMP